MNILKRTQEHITLLNKALALTQEIAVKTKESDLENVVDLSENRERLVQLIFHLFNQIDRELNLLTAEEITPALVNSLKVWQEQMNILVDTINQLDQEVIEALETNKEQTTGEIAQIFQAKENLKGYNLNNVKR